MIYGVKNGQEALYAARHWQDGKTRLLVLPDDRAVTVAESAFALFAPEIDRIVFPAWDCLPYDRLSPKTDIMGQRLRAIAELREKPKRARVVFATPSAFVQRMPADSGTGITLKTGKDYSFSTLPDTLSSLGFVRTLTVREPGEFAMRGDLLDLFPPGYEEPVRIAFFGDQLETMDHFDPSSQLRTNKAKTIQLEAAGEVRLNAASISSFREGYREAFGALAGQDPLYQAVSEGRFYEGMEHYLPLFTRDLITLPELVDEIILGDGAKAAIQERLNHIQDLYGARLGFMEAQGSQKKTMTRTTVIRPLPSDSLYMSAPEVAGFTNNAETFSAFSDPDIEKEKRTLPDFAAARRQSVKDAVQLAAATIREYQNKDYKTLFASGAATGLERMQTLLEGQHFDAKQLKYATVLDDIKSLKKDQLGLVTLPLAHGFIDDNVIILTEGDVFGDRLQQKPARKKASDTFFKEFTSLQPGDLVVHRDHGVGRFDGLEAVSAGGAAHDCLRIVYEGGDRLFVPVEAMDVLSRYGDEDAGAQLDKLGSQHWQARKAKVRRNVLEIAGKLIELAAQRQLKDAPLYAVPQGSWHEFNARFPYAETDDQLRAIDDIVTDLNKGAPMDRLVCGDVGFGKTEVALRAAFIVAQNGDQVAVTVPTTLLARQHFENFRERFAGFNLKIAELSRLNTVKENVEIKQGLTDGSVNIVIGTHALLAESIKFARLGLVIVDEEQRFGVKQKEKLKELQKDVHVLTLTATPIPRTLQMALTGVRDLSLITTAPVDRLAIRSFVAPFDPVMVREALMREHYRNGQSFIVCPRISDIEDLEDRLRELVPELSFITAHGQMPGTLLEERMGAFIEGKYDILLSTTIIESGIDIPRANTMIIHRADMFGLAQLYQLRGRIGRAKQRGYAYLTFEGDVALTEMAQKRLHVLESLDQLGGGFQLASHDMDIRGAGNLLGDAQSGHIKEVGIELYQQMLEDAVAEARMGGGLNAIPIEAWTPTINLGLPVFIPENYVPDLSVRIALYRRLASLVQQDEIDAFADELLDRFGPLPDEVKTLLDTIRIKSNCLAANIEKVDAGPNAALITFKDNKPTNPNRVFEVIQEMGGLAKFRPDQKVQISGALDSRSNRIKVIRRFTEALVFSQNSSTLVA